jgi:DNA-binding NarL/FixJ family response regulator
VGFEITARKYGGDDLAKTDDKTEGGAGMVSGAPRTVTPLKGGTRSSLTERELQVLSLMAEGYTNLDIARILSLSPHTVKSHTRSTFTTSSE